MINMISLTKFDNQEMPKDPTGTADTDACLDGFSALLAALVSAPADGKNSAPTAERPEGVQPAAQNMDYSQSDEPEFDIEAAALPVIPAMTAGQLVSPTGAGDDLVIFAAKIERKEFVSPLPQQTPGINHETAAVESDPRIEKVLPVQAVEPNGETNSADRRKDQLNFFVPADERIKVSPNVQSGDPSLLKLQLPENENRAIIRTFSQESAETAPVMTSHDLPSETEMRESGGRDFQPQLHRGISDFPPQNNVDAFLPSFRDISAGLKIKKSESSSEETDKFSLAVPEKSLKFVEQGAVETLSGMPADEAPPFKFIEAGSANEKIVEAKVIKADMDEGALKPVIADREIKPNAESAKFAPLAAIENLLTAVGRESKFIAQTESAAFPIRSEKILEQILTRLHSEISVFAGKNEKADILKLRLRPAELGVIEIKLEKSETGGLEAHLRTESDTTRQILMADFDQLRESLLAEGWHIERLEISSGLLSSTGSDNRENHSRQAEEVENTFVQTDDFDNASEKKDDSTPNRLVSLRA